VSSPFADRAVTFQLERSTPLVMLEIPLGALLRP
jgi:hypothetical protein